MLWKTIANFNYKWDYFSTDAQVDKISNFYKKIIEADFMFLT